MANTFLWTPNTQEGTYQVRVTARDYTAGIQSAPAVASFVVSSLVTSQPVVVPTANPLVALFSAPSCPAGSSMRIGFTLSGQSPPQNNFTNWRPCHPPTSMNFYIAGMLPSSTYYMRSIVLTGGTAVASPNVVSFTTGPIPPSALLPINKTLVPPTPQSYTTSDVVFNAYWYGPLANPTFKAYPDATDLSGNVIWYLPSFTQITRLVTGDPLLGTTILTFAAAPGTGTGPNGSGVPILSALSEIDLAGNVLRQTNSDRISEQLVAMGTDPIYGLNHEAIRLPNGHTITIGINQRIFPAGTQGSTGPVDILGMMLIELDQNFQVVWYWNAFDHAQGGTQLDINRASTTGVTCTTGAAGCPPTLLLSPANDWMHGNSIQYQPADGSLVVSVRDQDWVIKIDYGNGTGTQQVLWRLGLGGDFTMNTSYPNPWFSGQHDAEFQYGGGQVMSVFDDGNTRILQNPGQASRGQVLYVDQTNMVAKLILNQGLGVVSIALGSAQLLPNGNYYFDGGWTTPPGAIPGFENSFELTPAGTVAYEIGGSFTNYRSWRMPDLYTLPTFTSIPPVTLSCPASTATHGVAYSSAILASGGVAPYTFAVGPALPAGLSLNTASGAVTGTPATAGTFSFGVQAVDVLKADQGTKMCAMTVN